MFRSIFTRRRITVAALTMLFALLATASTNLIGKQAPVHAQSDCVLNIVCNGLSGSSDADYIRSFQSLYANGSDGHNNDLKSVYSTWMGASSATVNSMNTTNTVLGTVTKDGKVTVNGHVVGTGAVITARFGQGRPGFSHVEGSVYSRPVTTYEYYNSVPAIVYMQNGKMVFFVETPCGNAGKATPTPPVVGNLTCTGLNLLKGAVDSKGDTTYTLEAHAGANNALVTNYVFDLGSGHGSQTVATNSLAASSNSQVYAPGSYTMGVTVSGVANSIFATAPGSVSCTAHISVPQPPKAVLECTSLTLTAGVPDSTGAILAKLEAKASVSNATITKYVFDFGSDQNSKSQGTEVVTTGSLAASTSHTYAPGTYENIKVTVYGTDNFGQTISSTGSCVTNLHVSPPTCVENSNQPQCTTPPPTCTAPNGQTYPVGSSQCSPTPPPTVVTATTLPNTGPGDIMGIFAGTSVFGTASHYVASKRRRR